MRILMWHVHGSWTTSFVQGGHEYLLPVTPDRGPDGRGRADTWDWPASVVEVPVEELAGLQYDVALLQRPHEPGLVAQWTGRTPGVDVPAVYLEHNTPSGPAVTTRHPLADQAAIPIAHVTHFNRLMWDSGLAPTFVVEHGIVDPGHRYTGELDRVAVAVNEPVRRGRAVGTDLLPLMARSAPLDVFGMVVGGLPEHLGLGREVLETFENLPQSRLHEEVPRRVAYLHLHRWTSLGLSLLEAMHLGMPVVALATTETQRAVPREAGVVSTDPGELADAAGRLLRSPAEAKELGHAAREVALERYGLGRFLRDCDEVLRTVVAG